MSRLLHISASPRGDRSESLRLARAFLDAYQEAGPAFGADFQRPFFEDWLWWAGITDIETVEFRPDLATPDADDARRAALARARDLGKVF